MVSQDILDVIKIIVSKLANRKVNWAIIGSSNLALQGVELTPSDIDILTNKTGAYLIESELSEYMTQPLSYSETGKFKSYFGKLVINGIKIEIMGELVNINPGGDLWSETTDLSKKIFIKRNGIKIPVISLEQEYQAYLKLNREGKAKKIKEVLDKNRAD